MIIQHMERDERTARYVLFDSTFSRIFSLALSYADFERFLFVGRGYEYPTSLEAALKLIEE